jgi:hypothetical protein
MTVARSALMLGVLALGLLGAPFGSTPRTGLFASAAEARDFLLSRTSLDSPPISDAYAESYLRTFVRQNGEILNYRLLPAPDRELALAEAFRDLGFPREALYHY